MGLNIEYTKDPRAISTNLSHIVSEYNSFKTNMEKASNYMKSMDENWFGPERDGFVTTWNRNLDVSNKYLKNMHDASINLNTRFKYFTNLLGFHTTDINVKALTLSTFPSKNKSTGNVDSSKLLKTLSDYKTAMKDAIINLSNLKDQTTENSIGIIDKANGGFGQDIKDFHQIVTHVYEQISKLNKDTIGFVDTSISNLTRANS